MNPDQGPTHPDHPGKAQFLRLFLSSERELFRYVAALVANVDDAEEIVQQTAVVLWEKFDQYDHRQPFTPPSVTSSGVFSSSKDQADAAGYCHQIDGAT